MTDAEFRQYSNDPIQVEQYKTAYTNHYLEYKKQKDLYENIDKTIAEFVSANRFVWKYFWTAVFNLVGFVALVSLLIAALLS